MNRKNLTAAVLAGLAGVAGIAGTAQAVNLNPDGLGQVLIYPYYTSNDGNQTILSVVNTTEQAKAVKVRFLEGFNSREVLDFNLYMSHHDVWAAAIADVEGTPTLMIPDNSCTVPYLYQMGVDAGYGMGMQSFLDIAYSDNGTVNGVSYDFSDGGPTGIGRAAEGHFEIIEMGTIYNDTVIGEAVTHDPATGAPADCALLTAAWTRDLDTPADSGQWILDVVDTEEEKYPGVGTFDIERNSGGLFGGAAVVNANNGTMFSYDAIAVQGFDKFEDELGLNYEPGTIYPSLNSGDQNDAWLFFGPPTNEPWNGYYEGYDDSFGYFDTSVDAVSALFMKSNIVNEYIVDDAMNAGTEWIITFPTKNFYADWARMCAEGLVDGYYWEDDMGYCYEWSEGTEDYDPYAREPFTKLFADTQMVTDDVAGDYEAPDCEVVYIKTWDREEGTFIPDPVDPITGTKPPVVSPSLPTCDPGFDPECTPEVEEVPFQLCNEVNVLRFGEEVVFGTPMFDQEALEGLNNTLLVTVEDEFESGWGRIRFDTEDGRMDSNGLVGLPVTGFAAYEFENGYLDGGSVKANYGGLFKHKGLVTRTATPSIMLPIAN